MNVVVKVILQGTAGALIGITIAKLTERLEREYMLRKMMKEAKKEMVVDEEGNPIL